MTFPSSRGLVRQQIRLLSTSSKHRVTVGIRREDPTRIWERRTPLTPEAVNKLISQSGVDVHVESCERRVFKDEAYVEVSHDELRLLDELRSTYFCYQAGAHITPNLSGAHIILGIKEPPLSSLQTSPIPSALDGKLVPRTYMMFSHTAKGQSYNMPLLAAFLGEESAGSQLLPRLVDFELLTSSGKRTVGFGWFAGGKRRTQLFALLMTILQLLAYSNRCPRWPTHISNWVFLLRSW